MKINHTRYATQTMQGPELGARASLWHSNDARWWILGDMAVNWMSGDVGNGAIGWTWDVGARYYFSPSLYAQVGQRVITIQGWSFAGPYAQVGVTFP
jgi:hypothetical protein